MANPNIPATRSNPQPTTTATVVQPAAPTVTLRLRAEPAEQRHIQWAEDVVDNEGMGKKSSKGMMFAHFGANVLRLS